MAGVIDAAAYIHERVTVAANGCWIWKLDKNEWGYGRTRRPVLGARLAHRIAWRALVGPIPDDRRVLHNCPGGDNPACCNPEHLFLGTDADNMQDMVRKGRNADHRGELSATAKLTDEAVRHIRATADGATRGPTTISALARQHGVSRRAIKFALGGTTWRHVA